MFHLDAFAEVNSLDTAVFKHDIKEKHIGKKLVLFFFCPIAFKKGLCFHALPLGFETCQERVIFLSLGCVLSIFSEKEFEFCIRATADY